MSLVGQPFTGTDMKTKIALTMSIISFVLIHTGLNAAADFFEIPTYINYGETITVIRGSGRYSYDEEIDGEKTEAGVFIVIASIMLAWRVYHWFLSGRILGSIPKKSHITWSFWMLGITSYILITTPIWAVDIPGIAKRIAALSCGIIIAALCHHRHNIAQTNIKTSTDIED